MIFDLGTLTTIHTALSLIALVAGVPVVSGLVQGRSSPFWTHLFLWMAVATTVTGFIFPFNGFLPSHGVGVAAVVTLVPTLLAYYRFRLAGPWRSVYALGAIVNFYFLVFVGIVQAFLKIPVIHAVAPTQSEPAFAISQFVALVACVLFGFLAVRGPRHAARI